MKTIAIIMSLAMAIWVYNSEKLQSSLEVNLQRMENRIVTASGKGEVVIKLHARRLDQLREAAVHSKALRMHYEARLNEVPEAAGDTKQAQNRMAVDRLIELETRAKERYDSERKRHAELKLKVRQLEEQLALVRTISASADSVGSDSFPKEEDVTGLIDSLEMEVRRAEASLEIALEPLP